MSDPHDSAAVLQRRKLALGAFTGAIPEVGPWLWAMEDARRATLDTLGRIERAGFGQEFLDWRGPDGKDNSVAALLYHIAIVEASWLYVDMLMEDPPADIRAVMPFDDRDERGDLAQVPGLSFGELREKLAYVRERFLEVVSELSLEEWQRFSAPENEEYEVTPGWIVYHLVEHEHGHLYEIRRMVRKWLEAKAGRST